MSDLAERVNRLETKLDRITDLLEGMSRAPKGNGQSGGGYTQAALQRVEHDLAEVEGSAALRERLTETLLRVCEPETLDSLTRLAILAPKLEVAANVAAAAPELLDEALHAARARADQAGLEEHELQRRLSATTEALVALSGRPTLEALQELGQAAPALTPVSGAAADAFMQLRQVETPAQTRARLSEALIMIAHPETLESLVNLATLAPKLEYAAHAAAAGPELLEEALEALHAQSESAGISAHDLQRRLQAASETAVALSSPPTLAALRELGQAAPALSPLSGAAADALSQLQEVETPAETRQRLGEALVLLAHPETLESLVNLAILAPKLEYAAHAAAAGPELLEEALELVRHKLAEAGTSDHELRRRLEALTTTGLMLSEPTMLEALGQAAKALSESGAAKALELAALGPRVLERALSNNGLSSLDQLEERLTGAMSLAIELSDPAMLARARDLTSVVSEAGVSQGLQDLARLAPQLAGPLAALPIQAGTLELLKTLNEVANEAPTQAKPRGAWGLFRALSDPEVQRAAGFAVTAARMLGTRLQQLETQRLPG